MSRRADGNKATKADKTDCFAYKPKKCVALNKKQCSGCRFYKTEEQVKTERKKAMERILSLDEDTRNHITGTYFGGDNDGRI